MNPKTPQFNIALDAYFAQLVLDEKGGSSPRQSGLQLRGGGQWRTCRFSGERFYVRSEDIAFYKEMQVPLPTLSPLERARRRMAFSPGYRFFKVKSAATGKLIVSVYPPNTQFKIYEHEVWFSDAWDALAFGRAYNASRPFFEQLSALMREIPRQNLITDSTNINSEYTNNSTNLKNCYMTFDGLAGENLYYTEFCPQSKDCVDSWLLQQSQQCYKSWGGNLYNCIYCHYTYDTLESAFLYDCRNCESCFMCANLRNKKYCFYNEQLTKEEYAQRMRDIDMGDYRIFSKYILDFEELKKNAIHKNTFNERAVNAVGDWISNSRDCYFVLFAYSSERLAYAQGVFGYRDSYDVIFGMSGERCYELMAASVAEYNFEVKFSALVNNSYNLEYCESCRDCRDCFGCAGISNRSYCIFNMQYEEDTYWCTVDTIKTAMLHAGEYGEFPSPALSPFPYNAALVATYRGYSDLDVARRYGYRIEELPEEGSLPEGIEMIKSSELPFSLRETDDSILKKIIFDEANHKKFLLTSYELGFYRKHNLPIPRVHPLVRMNEWRSGFDFRLHFFERSCDRCGKSMATGYAPDRPEKNIYCEECYHEIIG